VALRSMKALEQLDTGGWHVSDEGLAKLRDVKNLKKVYLGISKDQEARRQRLQGLLPSVTID
jgi:hypothetical protein